MSPSRGFLPPPSSLFRPRPRYQSTFQTLSKSPTPLQIYISRSHNPFHNLSLEHHLFTTNPPSTTATLFLYQNAPSIVIGRNQNPWVEVNLPLVLSASAPQPYIVRRRSGGGTVFHDLGNVNYSVAVPTGVFDRDRHAVMVVKALRALGVCGAVVNSRHDIVVLPDGAVASEMVTGSEKEMPCGARKVSGSAYKLTAKRSYHHGTMLLSTRLQDVGGYLGSPAKGWIKARGVHSVRSDVANVGVGTERFVEAVVEEFGRMYGDERIVEVAKGVLESGEDGGGDGVGVCWVDDEVVEGVEGVKKGVEELMSPDWIYGQTPQFTFSVPAPKPDTQDAILPKSSSLNTPQPPENSSLEITANKGIIQSTSPNLCHIIGQKFDGSTISSALQRDKNSSLATWVESILGHTQWAKQCT